MIAKSFFSVLILLAYVGLVSSNEEVCLQSMSHSFVDPPNTPKPFVFYSMPKTGTHLVYPLLKKLTNREPVWVMKVFPGVPQILDLDTRNEMFSSPSNVPLHWFLMPVKKSLYREKLFELKNSKKFLFAHTPYSKLLEQLLKKDQYVVFYVMRDPRDFVISLLNHVNNIDNSLHFAPGFFKLGKDQQIRQVILGTDWYNAATTIVKEFYKWKDSPICCTINFEKLVGARGEAYSNKDQLEELRKIACAINLKITDEDLLKAFNETYGTGYTFDKCKVGRWKDLFNEDNKRLFKEVLGEELIEMGYESDYDW